MKFHYFADTTEREGNFTTDNFPHDTHQVSQGKKTGSLHGLHGFERVSESGLWSHRFRAGGRNTPISKHKIPYIPPTLKE